MWADFYSDDVKRNQFRVNDADKDQVLNPYGQYVALFARNHGMSFDEATQQPMVKARLEYYNKTGL